MREESIKKILKEEIEVRRRIAEEENKETYEKNQEMYIQKFVKLMDCLLKKCIELQNIEKENPKDGGRNYKTSLKYICISYLRVGVETGEGEYLIRMYDDTYYYDTYEVEGRYKTEYRQSAWKLDQEYFTKSIMSQVIRAKKYEVKDFLKEYLFDVYIKPIPEEIIDSLERIKGLDSYSKVKKDNNLAVYYRELYGKTEIKIPLYIKEKKG